MNKSNLIREYLDKFPDIPTMTLAKKIYSESPELFTSLESCRTLIRYVRGNFNKKQRDQVKDPSKTKYFRQNGKAGETFMQLPKPRKTLKWDLFNLKGDSKTLIIGDVHIPFFNRDAVELTVDFAQKEKVDQIILNGDIFDFYSVSRWQTDPRLRDFGGEISDCRQFLGWLREQFPNARIIYKDGNHEERFEKYLIKKAPELLDIDKFQLAEVLELEKYKVERVQNMRPIMLNDLAVIHGHEYKFSISNPVNPARGLFLRTKMNAITNHFHQSSSHSEKSLKGAIISCWSIGHLAEENPEYMPLNKWNLGFAIVQTFGSKYFNVRNYKIIDKMIFPA